MCAMEAIERAIGVVGSAVKLAVEIGISPQYLSQLRTGARPVPADRCPDIERATFGHVRCEDLRPDVDWGFIRATDCEVKAGASATATETHKEAA